MITARDVKQFAHFAARELNLPSVPQIKLVGASENAYDKFGHARGSFIVVRLTDRHPIDVVRAIAHDLIQMKRDSAPSREQPNAVVNRIVRKFDAAHPSVFRDKSVKANMLFEDGLAAAPVNATGPAVAGFDPKLGVPVLRRHLKHRKTRR